MWFAGMNAFQTVYVFNDTQCLITHPKEFAHMIPHNWFVNVEHVRAPSILSTFEVQIEISANGVDPNISNKSRIMRGFCADTMTGAVKKLTRSVV